MFRTVRTLIALAATIAASACGSTSSSTVAGPSPAKCQLAATNSTPNFTATGGPGNIVVQAARECAWSAAAQVAWVVLTPPLDGQGDGTLKYTVQANPSGLPRRGSVNVAGQAIDVGQEGAPCRFTLDPSRVDVAADASSVDVSVQGPAGCGWTAAPEADWIAVAQGAQGNGPGRVTLRVTANAGAARTGAVLIGGIRLQVTQASLLGPPPPPPPTPPPTGCTFTVNPSSGITADPAGQSGSISVDTTSTCAWEASSSVGWIDVAPTSQTGSGQVTYTIAANTESTQRTGSITVAGTSIAVTQGAAGEPPPPPNQVTLTGTVSDVTGNCPAVTFSVEGRTVNASSSTVYTRGSCDKVKNGSALTVTGTLNAQGTVDATTIDFK